MALIPASNQSSTPQSVGNFQYLQNLDRYVADGKKADVLYEHQKAIIGDTAKFLRAGNRRGFIEAPTGTGKTVLFVTLAEAFSYHAEKPPKILVVTPTKDLVRQTLGSTLGDKGFAGFAPHISTGTFYSDTPSGMRSLESQVTITTYASLSRLANATVSTVDVNGTQQLRPINLINETFDIIFLDEGHKALGSNSRRIIQEISSDILIIGFTATPDYHATRSLEHLLPTPIHRLDLKEAIRLEMLSSVIPVALPAPATQDYDFALSTMGEYESTSLKALIYNQSRNQLIVNVAHKLITEGNTPIISCIPGETMTHPHLIAELLAEKHVTDKKGYSRPLQVRAITSSISAAARQKIYAELEKGEVDALTYIDVLTEGWDSKRANVIINARPTRSLVAARQRTGRILRTKADGRPALAIDIIDPVSPNTAPQVSMADIFTLSSLKSGAAIGTISESFKDDFLQVINAITTRHGKVETILNNYTQYAELLESLPQLTRGQASITQNGKVRTFSSARRLFTRLSVDSFCLEYLKKHYDIETRPVRRYQEIVEAYDEDQIQQKLTNLPISAHTGKGLRVGETLYIGLNELITIIRRKHPHIDVTYEDVESIAHEIIKHDNQLHFTKRFRARTHRGIIIYTAQTMVSVPVGQSIVASFDNTLLD